MRKAASFFTGIGGLDLAFAWSGFDIVYQCEIDDYCRQVLKKWKPVYWPHARQGKDIRDVKGSDVGEVDVIFGGFPCQDISVAGKQAGIKAGNRSGLWFELVRIISEVRPRVVMLENVAAILTNDGTTVIASLAEIGYDAQWTTVRASDVGAPHRRERWFCVAYDKRIRHKKQATTRATTRYGKRHAQNRQRPQVACQAIADSKGMGNAKRTRLERQKRRKFQSRNVARSNVVKTNKKYGRQRNSRSSFATGSSKTMQFRTSKSRLGRASHGITSRVHRPKRISRTDHHAQRWPSAPTANQYAFEPARTTDRKQYRTDRVKALGNAVVPQQALPIVATVKELLNTRGYKL